MIGYDDWLTRTPDPDPSPGDHRPYNSECQCEECEWNRRAEPVSVGSNGCSCDFCTGKKKREDNWCARCGKVQMVPPKWWENLDACDACEEDMRIKEAEEDA